MREHIAVTIGGTKTFLGKTSVRTMLHCDSTNWYSTVQEANLKIMKRVVRRGADLSFARRRREKLLCKKRPHSKETTAVSNQTLTLNNFTEQRNLSTLA